MIPWNVFKAVPILVMMTALTLSSQEVPKVVLNVAKPIVYVEFDHTGPREPVEDGEPKLGLWLRLVNNSVIPIDVEVMNTATKSGFLLLPDVITPIEQRIPQSGPTHERMPLGYASGLGTVQTISPGKDLVFSVPVNHVSPNWFMQVPFRFSLPPVKEGGQPICYAPFIWEDLPQSYRELNGGHSGSAETRPGNTLLHESGHVDPPKPQ